MHPTASGMVGQRLALRALPLLVWLCAARAMPAEGAPERLSSGTDAMLEAMGLVDASQYARIMRAGDWEPVYRPPQQLQHVLTHQVSSRSSSSGFQGRLLLQLLRSLRRPIALAVQASSRTRTTQTPKRAWSRGSGHQRQLRAKMCLSKVCNFKVYRGK